MSKVKKSIKLLIRRWSRFQSNLSTAQLKYIQLSAMIIAICLCLTTIDVVVHAYGSSANHDESNAKVDVLRDLSSSTSMRKLTGDDGMLPVQPFESNKYARQGGLDELNALIAELEDQNRIIISVSNFGYLDFVNSFVCQLEQLNMDNYLVVALDNDLFEHVAEQNIHVFQFRHLKQSKDTKRESSQSSVTSDDEFQMEWNSSKDIFAAAVEAEQKLAAAEAAVDDAASHAANHANQDRPTVGSPVKPTSPLPQSSTFKFAKAYDNDYDGLEIRQNANATGRASFGSKEFVQISKRKSRVVLQILMLGYDVLFSDIDVVWLKPPWDRLSTYTGDILIQSDALFNSGTDPNFNINSGLYFARSNHRTIEALKLIIGHGKQNKLSEQKAFNHVLCGAFKKKMNLGPGRRIGPDRCELYHKGEQVSVQVFNADEFPNGSNQVGWSSIRAHVRNSDTSNSYDKMYIMHANNINDTSIKIDTLMEVGLWYRRSDHGSCIRLRLQD